MRLLVVDDDLGILDLLGQALGALYEVKTAKSGEEAMEVAAGAPPDLAIVDVGLPGIDGLELTRLLRARFANGSYLPVVAITGEDEPATRARAYEVGCDDVMGKPFSIREVLARVESLLLRRRQQRLKEDLAALVVHDLRNPLSALRLNLECLKDETADASPMVKEIVDDCHALTQRVLTLVGGLLDVAELEEGLLHAAPVEVELATFLPRQWLAHQPDVRVRGLTLDLEVDPADARARFDPDLVGRVIENLLDNAVRYARSGGRVRVGARRQDGVLVLFVANDGPAVPPADRPRVFEKFFRIEERRAGARANRGLGLYFCKLVADAHRGRIAIEETADWPCVFQLVLPQ